MTQQAEVTASPEVQQERRETQRADRKYQMLPHAKPGGIAGFLELIVDQGGRHDVFRLAEQLHLEADDLLPLTEAAAVLGFANLREGDVEITDEGRAFADADILTRKVLFRQAALKNVQLLRQIDQTLHAKADHTIPVDFFENVLDDYFSKKEVERQLDTAIEWGRYAEVFDYEPDSGRMILADLEAQHPETPSS